MPTEQLKSLLDRDLSIAFAWDRIDPSSRVVKEIVNFSTNAFARCAQSAKGDENEDTAALALYLHIIEMADGAEVLISQCCAVPASCKPKTHGQPLPIRKIRPHPARGNVSRPR